MIHAVTALVVWAVVILGFAGVVWALIGADRPRKDPRASWYHTWHRD